MGFLRRLVHRLWGEAFTRAGRRRLLRRVASRFLIVFVVVGWTHPFVAAFWQHQFVDLVSGRVVVAGPDPAPVLRTVVVLVPAPPDPSASGALVPYLKVDPGAYGLDPSRSANLELDLWPDVSGRFATMHVVLGRPYRLEVRRTGCPTVDFGVRTFRLLGFFGRRLSLEVPPCLLSC